jgi:Ca2+-binding RTX toxin-like protein
MELLRMARMEDALRFTIEAGIVTAVFEYDDGLWKPERLDAGETYSVDPGNTAVVIRTEINSGRTETDRYLTSDGGLTYYKLDAGNEGDDSEEGAGGGEDDGGDAGEGDGDLYRFVFDASDAIVSATKFDDGVWKPLRLDRNESFGVDPAAGRARVTMTEVDDGESDVEVFEDLDGDGNYIKVDSADNLDDDIYFGSSLADVARGGIGADDLYGDSGDDDLYGDAGDDDLYGDDGDDDLYGGIASDELYGGAGGDDLSGDAGDDHLSGESGNDDLDGGDGADDLEAGAGRDKLTGGRGLDRLAGGLGADRFQFLSKLDSAVGLQRDAIVDFSASQRDRINLVAVDANDLRPGNQVFTWLGSRSFSGVAGQLRYGALGLSSGIVLQADVNGDRTADFEISLPGLNSLAASSVML